MDERAREVIDQVAETGIDQLPPGGLKKMLTEFGWVGLLLGVLIGNIPVSVALTRIISGEVKADSSAVSIYWSIFLLVTPFVAVTGVVGFLLLTGQVPVMAGHWYVFWIAVLIFGSAWLSLVLGGTAPLTALMVPESGSPGGLASYSADSLGAYFRIYGPWPCLAGIIQGAAFARWGALLHRGS